MTGRLLAVALVVAAPAASRADSALTCHCFRDRSFDPDAPSAADPYLLATTRSSLLAAAFGVGKGDLVRAVMGGTPPEDLWIAHWAAARTRTSPAALLAARRSRGSWKAALAGARGLGTLGAAAARGAPDAELAAAAVDDVLASRLGVDPDSIAALHAEGAGTDEEILASFLAPRLRLPPPLVLARIRTGDATWGSALLEARIGCDEIEGAVRAAVAARGR